MGSYSGKVLSALIERLFGYFNNILEMFAQKYINTSYMECVSQRF